MGADEVVGKILADARAEAEKIKQQAEKERAGEKAKLDEQLSEYKQQTELLAQKKADDEKMHLLAAARMDIAKEHLAEKRKILDEVFELANDRFRSLSDDQYRELMAKLICAAVETGDEEVIVDTGEKRIDFDFIKQINRKLGPGYHGNLKLASQAQDIGAGFILRRGKIKNNVSIDVLLVEARKELEIELAKDLFANKT